MTELCAECGKPLAAPDDIVCDACLKLLHALVRGKLCSFGCGEPATVITSTDDWVCQACYEVFEDALEGDTDE